MLDEPVGRLVAIGAGATLTVDLWALARRRLFGQALPNWATVAAPFLILQPGMGLGLAGSRTPRPAATRIQSLITHAVFGIGLYATALLIR